MMNEDLRGLSGLMRDKGFTKPQGFENGGRVTANQMMGATSDMGTSRNTEIELDGKMYDTNSINYPVGTPRNTQIELDGKTYDTNSINYSMGTAPESAVPNIANLSSDMRAQQQMQKNDLMGQLLNLVGDDNPEVIKLLRDAPVSELMKAVQEITEANATVTSTSS